MGDICYHVDILNIKLAVGLSFCIDLAEEFHLVLVKVLAYLLNGPDVAEEFCTQVTIADHRLFDRDEMGIDEFDNFVLRRYAFCRHFVELIAQPFKFRFDNGIIDVFFTAEISIQRTATFPRRHGDVVHRCAVEPLLGKKLARHVDQFLSSLGYRH